MRVQILVEVVFNFALIPLGKAWIHCVYAQSESCWKTRWCESLVMNVQRAFSGWCFFFLFGLRGEEEKTYRQRGRSCGNLRMYKSTNRKHIYASSTGLLVTSHSPYILFGHYRVVAVCFVVLPVIFMCVCFLRRRSI